VITLRSIGIRIVALLLTLVFALTVSFGLHIYRQALFAEAAFRGNFFRMRTLYHLGVDVNAAGCPFRNCFTPLWGAAYGGRDDEIRFLLERGADVNRKTNFDSTALMVAVYKRHESTIRLLREAGANEAP
jgi:ankyrin repeat protein